MRPSLSVFEAADAAFFPVVFFGALVWDSALPAALLVFLLVAGAFSVLDAAFAALVPVTLLCAIIFSLEVAGR